MNKYQRSSSANYIKDYRLPLINIVPALIWSIPVNQICFSSTEWWMKLLVSVLFIVVYVWLSMVPFASVIPCLLGVVMFTALFWVPVDLIENQFFRVILKIGVLMISLFVEFGIFCNAIVPWLQQKK